MVRLCTEFQLSSLPGSALIVYVVSGGWVVSCVGGLCWRVNIVIPFDKALALAKLKIISLTLKSL